MRTLTLGPDEAARRYVAAIRPDLEPDPLFRRRLRGVVLNRFVAAREGLEVAPTGARRSAMGSLGRACLYASVALAISVGGPMAASSSALPGDPFYAVKLRIEALRFEVLPASFHDELLMDVLAQRIEELGALEATGEPHRAGGLTTAIEQDFERLAAIDAANPDGVEKSARRDALALLIGQLPAHAQATVQRAHQRGLGVTEHRGQESSESVGPPAWSNGNGPPARAPAGTAPIDAEPENGGPPPDRTSPPGSDVASERPPHPNNKPDPTHKPERGPKAGD